MYNFKIICNNTKSEEHLEDKITELNSSEVGIIDFKKPWNTKLIDLTETEWQELNEKGEITKTNIEKTTIFVKKTNAQQRF